MRGNFPIGLGRRGAASPLNISATALPTACHICSLGIPSRRDHPSPGWAPSVQGRQRAQVGSPPRLRLTSCAAKLWPGIRLAARLATRSKRIVPELTIFSRICESFLMPRSYPFGGRQDSRCRLRWTNDACDMG
jgi:hypothetical protein